MIKRDGCCEALRPENVVESDLLARARVSDRWDAVARARVRSVIRTYPRLLGQG